MAERPAGTEVLFREARKKLERERGENLDDDAVMEALCRAYLAGDGRADHPNESHAHVGPNEAHTPGGANEAHDACESGDIRVSGAVSAAVEC